MIPHFRTCRTWLAARLARAERPGFLFDLDGTLAPIVSHPSRTRVPAETLRELGRLADRARVAVISGRPVPEVRRLVPLRIWIVGNHGLEGRSPEGRGWRAAIGRFRRPLEEARAAAAEITAGWTGSWVEEKGFSFAIHYRKADPRKAPRIRASLEVALRRWPRLRVHPGKKVYEVRVLGVGDKGTAVDRLRRRWRADFTAYFGDDATDEDAFSSLTDDDLPVLVGSPKRVTAARFYLRDSGEVRRATILIRERIPAARHS